MKPHLFLLLLLATFLVISCGRNGKDVVPSATSQPTVGSASPTAKSAAAETLAFVRAGDVWLIDANGSNGRRLGLTGVQSFSWVSAEELDVVIGADQSGHLLVDLEGNPQQLPFPAGGSWSRDGTQYVVPVEQEIVVFDREGGEVARLQVTLPGEEGPKPKPPNCGGALFTGDGQPDRFTFGQPVFSPDGQSILVAVNCESRRGVTGSFPAPVYEVSLDGTVNQPLGDLQTNLEVLTGPRFSPDGAHVAQGRFVGGNACAGDYNVNVLPARGGAMRELTLPAVASAREEPRSSIRGGVVGYDWSPQSDSIIASVNASVCRTLDVEPYVRVDPVVAGLYILKLDGSPEEKLVDGPTRDPAWSPSGRYIAYVAEESFGQVTEPPLLRVFDRTTGAVRDLGEGSLPHWQPMTSTFVPGGVQAARAAATAAAAAGGFATHEGAIEAFAANLDLPFDGLCDPAQPPKGYCEDAEGGTLSADEARVRLCRVPGCLVLTITRGSGGKWSVSRVVLEGEGPSPPEQAVP